MRSGNSSWLALILVTSIALVIGACSKSDLSTPKAAAKSFVRAMEAGDAETAKACCVGAEPKAVEGMVKMVAAQKKFHDAAVSKFGDEAKNITGGDKFADAAKNIDEGTEQITGETATVTAKNGGPMKMKKVGGEWKVDMSDMRSGMGVPDATAFDAMAKAMNEMADEVNTGKYKNVAEAQMALQTKMMGAMMGGEKK